MVVRKQRRNNSSEIMNQALCNFDKEIKTGGTFTGKCVKHGWIKSIVKAAAVNTSSNLPQASSSSLNKTNQHVVRF